MNELSAGILLYRRHEPGTQVLIGHMGGPFWAHKDAGAWSIPKGECKPGEDPWQAALREFEEEVGTPAPAANYVSLGEFHQRSGKVIRVFAAESEFELDRFMSNSFRLEWPRGSGHIEQFPEVDAVKWVGEREARTCLVRGQLPILQSLLDSLEATDAAAGRHTSPPLNGGTECGPH